MGGCHPRDNGARAAARVGSRSHRALKLAARRVAEEQADDTIRLKFSVAEKCHINSYHGFLDDYEIEEVRPDVHDFVNRVLGLLE